MVKAGDRHPLAKPSQASFSNPSQAILSNWTHGLILFGKSSHGSFHHNPLLDGPPIFYGIFPTSRRGSLQLTRGSVILGTATADARQASHPLIHPYTIRSVRTLDSDGDSAVVILTVRMT